MDHVLRLADEYEERADLLRDLGPAVESILNGLLAEHSIPVHSVESRVKTKPSFMRKLAAGERKYSSIDAITDLLGVRIITYFSHEVDAIADLLASEFEIDYENSVDKRALLDADRFGYMSFHYVCSLSTARSWLPEFRRFSDLSFEIQIRSILQHAWAEIEHDLGYKTAQAVPNPIRRRFARLAGLLEIADDEFIALKNTLEEYSRDVTAQLSEDPNQILIDQATVLAFLDHNALMRSLDAAVAQALGATLVQDPDPEYAGALAWRLSRAGFVTIGEVLIWAEAIKEILPTFTKNLISAAGSTVDRGVSLTFLAYYVMCEKPVEELESFLDESGIGDPSVAEHFLAAYRLTLEE